MEELENNNNNNNLDVGHCNSVRFDTCICLPVAFYPYWRSCFHSSGYFVYYEKSLLHNADRRDKPPENSAGRVENAGNRHFLLFPPYFYPIKEKLQHLNDIEIVLELQKFEFGHG